MNKMGKEYQKSKRGEIDYEILWPKGYKMLYIKDTKATQVHGPHRPVAKNFALSPSCIVRIVL